jgi:hypothetical protein
MSIFAPVAFLKQSLSTETNSAYKRLGNQMSVIGQAEETSASLTLRRQPLAKTALLCLRQLRKRFCLLEGLSLRVSRRVYKPRPFA